MSGIVGSGFWLVAHGGVGGLVVEVGLTVGILFVFVAVWVRERRASKHGEADETARNDSLFRDEEKK